MKRIRKLAFLFLISIFLAGTAYANSTLSTVNPNIPAQNSPLSSSVMRSNFLAAYNDITNLWAQVYLGANQVLGSLTGTEATPLTIPPCTTGLTWTNGTGFGCASGGSGITALTGDVTASGTGSVAAALANSATARADLGLGTAATQNTGTSGANLGFLNGNNTYSGNDFFAGNLTLEGSNVFSGTNSFSALVTTTLNSSSLPTAQAGTLVQLGNANGAVTRLEADAFANAAHFSAVREDGTAGSPTTLQSGDAIGSFNVFGYNGTSIIGPQAAVRAFAAGNWTSSSAPTYIDIATTTTGSTTLLPVAKFNSDGGVTVGSPTGGDKGTGTLNAQGLYVNGVAVGGSLNPPVSLSLSTTSTGITLSSTLTGLGNNGYAGFFSNTDTGAVNYALYASTSSPNGYALYASGNSELNGNVLSGLGSLTTTATTGFLYLSTVAGVPSGVPAAFSGWLPMVYDSTDSRLYIYNGGWGSTGQSLSSLTFATATNSIDSGSQAQTWNWNSATSQNPFTISSSSLTSGSLLSLTTSALTSGHALTITSSTATATGVLNLSVTTSGQSSAAYGGYFSVSGSSNTGTASIYAVNSSGSGGGYGIYTTDSSTSGTAASGFGSGLFATVSGTGAAIYAQNLGATGLSTDGNSAYFNGGVKIHAPALNTAGSLLTLETTTTGSQRGLAFLTSGDSSAYMTMGLQSGGSASQPGLAIGAGGSSARDTSIYRSAAHQFTISNAAGGGGDLIIGGALTVTSAGVVMGATSTPADNAACTAGAFWWDTGFIYVCTASGTVKRATLNTY